MNMLSVLIFFFLLTPALSGRETRLEFGKDDGFRGMALIRGLDIAVGFDGTADLVLRDRQQASERNSDVYLSFDEDPVRDAALKFTVRNENNAMLISPGHKMRGRGAGAFQYGSRLLLTPAGGRTLFSRGIVNEDFIIEFWMYPATLNEGEVIFRWENTAAEGAGVPVYQELSCVISGRALLWTFTNYFRDVQSKTLTLRGSAPLVPRAWRHHALRFDAATGMVEYLVDGSPEAIVYATRSGREDGTVSYPVIAGETRTPLVIGEGFTGFLDEFSISRDPPADMDLAAYPAEGGTVETSLIDMGYGGCVLLRIEAACRAPADSAVFFYYRIGADTEQLWKEEWQPFIPGEVFPSQTGRYLLVKAELFPDGRRETSPRLMDFTVVYEKNLPPPPPSFISAAAGDGKVELRWSPVVNPEVRGYFIYYGSRPGVYDGKDSSLGPSPLRVEKQNSVTLEGLVNGKLYYFAVTAYDDYGDYLSGQFSNEVSARPSRLYQHE
ncbi:MAG: fibronectin type III domain-containing protein [Spirochaetales bacterium]|jgi:hypothetical protein|nr:fibronectin type III domain-containing protein [Spirochaetales bacterium]